MLPWLPLETGGWPGVASASGFRVFKGFKGLGWGFRNLRGLGF